MQAEPQALQLDKVLQFTSQMPKTRYAEFLNLTSILEKHHPAYRQFQIHQRIKQSLFEELCEYMQKEYGINCMGPEVHNFLWFIYKTYGLSHEGIEAFKKSLTQIALYQEWLTAQSGKNAARKKSTNSGYLRLVK